MTVLLLASVSALALSLAARLVQMGRLRAEGRELRRRLAAWSGEEDALDQQLEEQLAGTIEELAGRLEGAPPRDARAAFDVLDERLRTWRARVGALEQRRAELRRQLRRARALGEELGGLEGAMEAPLAEVEARCLLLEADRVAEGPRFRSWKPPDAG